MGCWNYRIERDSGQRMYLPDAVMPLPSSQTGTELIAEKVEEEEKRQRRGREEAEERKIEEAR